MREIFAQREGFYFSADLYLEAINLLFKSALKIGKKFIHMLFSNKAIFNIFLFQCQLRMLLKHRVLICSLYFG